MIKQATVQRSTIQSKNVSMEPNNGKSYARVLELLKIERECVKRNASNQCDRNCAVCDLVQNDTDLLSMYDNVISLVLEKQAEIESMLMG